MHWPLGATRPGKIPPQDRDRLDRSAFARRVLGDIVKRAEYQKLAHEVTEVEWSLYGFSV